MSGRARDPAELARGPRGDEAELYRSYHRKLVRTVQGLTNTSPDIVDDACAFAWVQFMRFQPDRNRSWRSWLVTVAGYRGLPSTDRDGPPARGLVAWLAA